MNSQFLVIWITSRLKIVARLLERPLKYIISHSKYHRRNALHTSHCYLSTTTWIPNVFFPFAVLFEGIQQEFSESHRDVVSRYVLSWSVVHLNSVIIRPVRMSSPPNRTSNCLYLYTRTSVSSFAVPSRIYEVNSCDWKPYLVGNIHLDRPAADKRIRRVEVKRRYIRVTAWVK